MNKNKFIWIAGGFFLALGLVIRYFDEYGSEKTTSVLTWVWVICGGVFVELLMQPFGRIIKWIKGK